MTPQNAKYFSKETTENWGLAQYDGFHIPNADPQIGNNLHSIEKSGCTAQKRNHRGKERRMDEGM